MKHRSTWTCITENAQMTTKYFYETILSLDFLNATEKATCQSYNMKTLKLSLTLHNQFKQKNCKSYINSIDELASGSAFASDQKNVALEFASYLSKSEPGLENNITHKCKRLVTR